MQELRCESGILHGVYDAETQTIEFKCRSNRCGHAAGVVVLHRFSLLSGEPETTRFKDPSSIITKEER